MTTADDARPSAEDLDTPAARLRYALTLRGTHAHHASLAADLGRSTVRWILDHPADSPRTSTLAALARALRVDPAWLAFGPPYPAPAAEVSVEGGRVEGEQLAPAAPAVEEQRQGEPLAAPEPSPAEVPADRAGGVPPARIRATPAPASRPSPSALQGGDLAVRSETLRARWRATPGASQRGFAARTGRSQSTLSRWLSGEAKVGALDTLDAVARYLDTLDAEHAARAASQTALPLGASRA